MAAGAAGATTAAAGASDMAAGAAAATAAGAGASDTVAGAAGVAGAGWAGAGTTCCATGAAWAAGRGLLRLHSRLQLRRAAGDQSAHQRDYSNQADNLAKHRAHLQSMRLCRRSRLWRASPAPSADTSSVASNGVHSERQIVCHSVSLAYLRCNSCGPSPNC